MKKRLVLYSTLAIMALLVLWYRFGLFRGVTPVNYCRISSGMTMADVDSLLSGAGEVPWFYGEPIRVPNQSCAQHWRGYGGTIIVFYDMEGRVAGKEWDWIARERIGVLDQLVFELCLLVDTWKLRQRHRK